MELMKAKSIAELWNHAVDMKYAGGNWIPTSNRIDKVVDNHIKNDPIKNRDYIVSLRLRYAMHEKFYFSNELLFRDYNDKYNEYCWMNDWYEGQQDIDALAITPIDTINESEFEIRTEWDLSGKSIPEKLDNILSLAMEWCEKYHDCITSVIVRLRYKCASDEWEYTNQYLDFDGNDYSFEWLHDWWTQHPDINDIELCGILDTDEIDHFDTVFMKPEDPSYYWSIKNVFTTEDDKRVYTRFDGVLKRFIKENDCIEGEELVVLWVHKTDDNEYVLRKDVFVLADTPLWDTPEKIYLVPGLPMSEFKGIEIWAIQPIHSVKLFDYWFETANSIGKRGL